MFKYLEEPEVIELNLAYFLRKPLQMPHDKNSFKLIRIKRIN